MTAGLPVEHFASGGTPLVWRAGSRISFVWHGVCPPTTNPAHSVSPCCGLIEALLLLFPPPPFLGGTMADPSLTLRAGDNVLLVIQRGWVVQQRHRPPNHPALPDRTTPDCHRNRVCPCRRVALAAAPAVRCWPSGRPAPGHRDHHRRHGCRHRHQNLRRRDCRPDAAADMRGGAN